MGTLKMCKCDHITADNVDRAINILYNRTSHTVVLYASRMEKLEKLCSGVYAEIARRNKEIPNVNDQMLPTEPYIWDDIDGCLAVKCAEISMDVFSKSAECLHIFAQPKYSCLTDPSARKPLSTKAMTTLSMMGHMLYNGL